MSIWVQQTDVCFYRTDKNVTAMVYLDGAIWRSRVYVRGEEVDRGECTGRDSALRNALGAMQRACAIRRYEDETVRPSISGTDIDKDDDE